MHLGDAHDKKGRTFNAEYFSSHRHRLTTYVLPKFGGLALAAITTKIIDEWLMDLRGVRKKDNLSAATKQKLLVTVVKVFEEERELTLMLVVDVSRSSQYGSHEQFKMEILTEMNSLFKLLKI